jgi:uracil-DNA glycosylase
VKPKPAASADDIETLRDEAADCRACHLWKDATQTVFGEGPQAAREARARDQSIRGG